MQTQQSSIPNLMNRKELAIKLGLDPHTIWHLTKEGKIPAIRVGRSLRYRYEEVLASLQIPMKKG
jgi:excisionase family DNA binding protein